MEWSVIVVLVYAFVLIALAIYGVHFFYLALVAPRVRHRLIGQPLPDELPLVTVQLPIFNEYLVAERIIDAAARLDWPRDRFEIQVLDDSTDATREIAAAAVARWRSIGLNIQHLHRTQRAGYKAGALAAGLPHASGEFMAIFDADFVPAPDFLRRTIGVFGDPTIGFVQARWTHLNRRTSILTYLQSLSIDGHFMIEQITRAGRGYVMNFNGTAGVWRRAAIDQSGGWNPGTLTEDLDLSYRAALHGWRAAYLPDVTVAAELVSSLSAYRRQQARWAQGSIECARRLLPMIRHSPLPRLAKIEAGLHLTGYGIQVLMLLAAGLYPFLMGIQIPVEWHRVLFVLGLMLAPTILAPTFLFLTAQRMLRPRTWWREIPGVLLLSILGAGMMLNSTRSLWRGLSARRSVFDRTPKLGLVGKQAMSQRLIYRPASDGLIIAEILLAGWNFYAVLLAWQTHNPGIFLNALVFGAGLLIVSVATLWETHTEWKWLRMPLPDLEPEPAITRQS
jgi:cellulose synthase/poly-beta-1,6-N-acetylglucosamine synthase-like glycosyltransferase